MVVNFLKMSVFRGITVQSGKTRESTPFLRLEKLANLLQDTKLAYTYKGYKDELAMKIDKK